MKCLRECSHTARITHGTGSKKTREKMELCGLVELKGKNPSYGSEYYFTDAGLEWYLNLRPEHKMQRGS
jgi:hypothetical protein